METKTMIEGNRSRGALILFFKFPEKGRVKTRVAASLGDDFALGLYWALVQDVLSLSGRVDADKILAIDGPCGPDADGLDFGTGYAVIRQSGEDIGEKMADSFSRVFSSGYDRAVLIGGDLPDLPSAIVELALAELNKVDAVIGRSTDGGYYLIGFKNRSFSPGCFKGVEWGAPAVFQQTMNRLRDAGRVSVLRDWNDIDDLDDLKRFYEEKRVREEFSSCTMKFLMDRLPREGVIF